MTKLKAYLWQSPRWFGAPFFGTATLLGAVLAGGIGVNAWLGLAVTLLIMAGGHTLNSWGDWITGLDRGETSERSAEKSYTGGQNLIAKGVMGLWETFFVGLAYYALALIPAVYLAHNVSWVMIPLVFAGMGISFWYSLIAKFTWTHELSLGVGVGPLAVLLGMFAVSPHPPVMNGILVSVPSAIVLSFLGLALDEAPDWEANIKKGVHSMAFEVSRRSASLEWYCTFWLVFMLIFHVFLIDIGILKPLTAIAFIPAITMIPALVFTRPPMPFMEAINYSTISTLAQRDAARFQKVMLYIVAAGALYGILMLVGQMVG